MIIAVPAELNVPNPSEAHIAQIITVILVGTKPINNSPIV